MKLDKAIELLTELSHPGDPDLLEDDFDAIKLGIEALQWINQWRGVNSPLANIRLPSETKDE